MIHLILPHQYLSGYFCLFLVLKNHGNFELLESSPFFHAGVVVVLGADFEIQIHSKGQLISKGLFVSSFRPKKGFLP